MYTNIRTAKHIKQINAFLCKNKNLPSSPYNKPKYFILIYIYNSTVLMKTLAAYGMRNGQQTERDRKAGKVRDNKGNTIDKTDQVGDGTNRS